MENKNTDKVVLDAILVMAKAWFTHYAIKLGWDKVDNVKSMCKTWGCNYGVFEDVEDGSSNIETRLVIEIGLFRDCEQTPDNECEGCSEVESIQFSIGGECDTYDDLVLWMQDIGDDPSGYMPDFMWE